LGCLPWQVERFHTTEWLPARISATATHIGAVKHHWFASLLNGLSWYFTDFVLAWSPNFQIFLLGVITAKFIIELVNNFSWCVICRVLTTQRRLALSVRSFNSFLVEMTLFFSTSAAIGEVTSPSVIYNASDP